MNDPQITPLCECGCGSHTKVATSGPNRGKANRFVYGHNNSRITPVDDRCDPRVERACRVCDEIKPLSGFFKDKRRKDGISSTCRACHSERQRGYYAADPDRYIRRSTEWNRNNPELSNRYKAKWAEENPGAWKNADQALARERRRRWNKEHPEVRVEMAARRRARLLGTQSQSLTASMIDARMSVWGGRCWICGDQANNVDHVKPLGKGGSHLLCNLRPACGECNRRKSAKWPFPLSSRGALVALYGS